MNLISMTLRVKHKRVLTEIISLILILLFAYAGVTKFLEGKMFYNNIRNSPIFGGETIATIVAIVIPVGEIVTSFLIAWRRTRLIGLYGALVLMLLFTGYTVTLLFFTNTVPCSCGGIISLLSWEQHLMFILVLLLLTILNIAISKPIEK
ncbi:MauE/DoxX family redox-associated membrane protein [Gelidibacter salicanalis]|uniref:MauE/DoxX family redox-associated membrane protein n=1 Tax=Gelidibacter salicanalis TaxID=291193 RepID=UPI0034D7070F